LPEDSNIKVNVHHKKLLQLRPVQLLYTTVSAKAHTFQLIYILLLFINGFC